MCVRIESDLGRAAFYDVVVAFMMFRRGCGGSGYLSQLCFMAVINCWISMAILSGDGSNPSPESSRRSVTELQPLLQRIGHALGKVMAVLILNAVCWEMDSSRACLVRARRNSFVPLNYNEVAW